jgi:hypothetical protein
MSAPSQNVPGLGFDYVHLAAVSQPTRTSRANLHSGNGQFITPILSWGLPVYPEPQPAAPQPVVIVLQQPAPAVVVVPAPAPAMAPSAEAATPFSPASPVAAAPLPELGQFILVRRDGQIILAIAFSTSKDRLTYITRENTRHSFPLAQLDIEATQQMNDAAGATLTLTN